jgi:hypothetical protein
VSRGWNASAQTLLNEGGGAIVALLKIEFDTTLYLTDAQFPVVYDSNTYLSSSSILSIDNVRETSDIRVNTWGFTVAGTDQTWYSLLLGGDVIDTPVTYYLALLDTDYSVVDAMEIFTGTITEPGDIKETTKQSRIKINCASHWADWQSRPGRMCNPTSQEIFYPGDGAFFEYASKPLTDRRWTIKEKNG